MTIDLKIDPTQRLDLPTDKLNDCEFISFSIQQGATPIFWTLLETALSQLTFEKLKGFSLAIDPLNEPQNFSAIVNMDFWKKLNTLHLSGEIEGSCLEAILDQFEFQSGLANLSINGAQLTPEEADIIICKKPYTLEQLDLSGNDIKEYSGAPEDFKNFCKAVQESNLKELTLSSIGPKECSLLSEQIKNRDRYFKLNIFPDSNLSDEDLSCLINAMDINPYLTIEIYNFLGNLDDNKNLLSLNELREKNSFPRFKDLAALRLCEYLKSLPPSESKPIASDIPEVFINDLPLNDTAKTMLFSFDNMSDNQDSIKQSNTNVPQAEPSEKPRLK